MNRDCFRIARLIAGLGLFFILLNFAAAQQRPELSMQWALGESGSAVARVPKAMWLQDGGAIIYNERLPKEQRTFERL